MPHRRCLLAGLMALALGACGPGEPPPGPAPVPAPAPAADIEDEIFPHVSARMPDEALEPDGRMAGWAVPAQVGATLHALAEACGQHDAARLQRMQEEQRAALADGGVDMDRVEAVWIWAYRQARQKITLQSPAELERGCEGLQRMQEDAARMGAMTPLAP